MSFGAYGEYESSTYYSGAFTWHTDGDTLVLQPTNSDIQPTVYQVYDFLDGYYLLVQNINSMELLKIN